MVAEREIAVAGDTPDFPRLVGYLFERSPQPMVAVGGPTHVVRHLNPAFARLAGKTPDELLGRPFAEAVSEGEGNGCLALLDRVFRTGMPEDSVEQEHRQTPPAYWSYATWAILGADEHPAGVMIQVTDATAAVAFRRQSTAMNEALVVSSVRQHELIDTIRRGEQDRHALEVLMFRAQKLESLGVLAGGIAHDLNNMLTPILGFAELASHSLPDDSPAVEMLDVVVTSTRRAAALVQQILAYAGLGQFVVRPIDLSDLVRETAGLLGAVVSTKALLNYELARGLPPVEADDAQLRQVVMNLVTNAAEAVGAGGGTITVRTGLIRADHQTPGSPRPETDPPGEPSVFLEVADSGCGMTADVIEKIFDPFFTTKFVGRGLGLAVVQGIARKHHGALDVRSEPGRGSTFRLLLPCLTGAAAVEGEPQGSEYWRGAGTVLLIDDERGVRDIAARVLEDAGLTVLIAGGGEEGVRVFREHPRGIDAVVLDMTMPGMGGLEAARALRGLRSDLPVVLMSGYSVPEVARQSADLGFTGFVQKPFTMSDLLAAVRLALGQ
jgi:PAS domain S-box-containing protein